MKKTKVCKAESAEAEELCPEYNFDYRKARPNRFAARVDRPRVAVTLDPDVAKVFTTAESVNTILRALIDSMPRGTSGR